MRIKPEYEKLLRDGVRWVEWQDTLPEETREWLQDEWVMTPEAREESFNHPAEECGTGRCLAGWMGYQLAPGLWKDTWRLDEPVEVNGYKVRTVAEFVEKITGIDPYLGEDYLWDGANDAKMIRTMAEKIVGEPL